VPRVRLGPLGWRRPRLPAPLSPALPAPQPAPLPALLPAPLSTLLPALLAALCAAGCGSASDSYVVGSAKWRGFDVAVESRPAPPRQGKNEVVVIVTGEHQRPVFDAQVWVRAQAAADWVQAIEDGHVGVYRRAVDFGRSQRTDIEVRLQRGSDEGVLAFPVSILVDR